MRVHHPLSIAILLSSALLLSCGEGTSEADKKKEQSEKERKEGKQSKDKKENSHQAHGGKVELNDGKRWTADSSTVAGIRRMERILEEKPKGDLQDTLKGAFDRIFSECSMEGEGHQNLHRYLLPLKKAIGELDTNDAEVARKAEARIEKHLGRFDRYFK